MYLMESTSSNTNALGEESCDLVRFFEDLLEAEAAVFRLTDWGHHSIICSRLSPQHVRAIQESGYGLHILRHGRCTEDIHNYFRNYESYKCCLGLVGGQNIRTRLRLVKTDSLSQSSVDIGIDAAAKTSPYAAQVDLRLSDEEYRAFKCALWCAICPLLTAQKPPDDISPPLTPSEHQREHDLDIQHHRKLSLSKSRQYSIAMAECNVRDASLISSDVMRETLRRAFGLDKHLELYYLKLAYKFHKTKNDAQILAEDLCYQLSLLEKDAHPYYKSNSFLSQSAYNIWRLSKRRHIMELMNKFWCNALPPVGDVEKFDARSLHSDYRLLIHKLLRQQKINYSKDPSTVVFAVVPSEATRKILTEFSLRYGIDELYHLATYLEYLILNFEIEKDFINLVTETIQNIMSLLPPEKTTAMLVRQQVEQLESFIRQLFHRCEHLFSHIQTVFVSSNSCDSIGSLIHLLEQTVMLRDYLCVTEDGPVTCGEMIQSYLEVNFQLIYIEHKTSALSDATSRGESCQLSPRVVNRIMLCLRDDLADYRNNYQTVFTRYFNITNLSSVALYEFLMRDVLELCQQIRTQNETEKVNFGMIGLIYRLNTLDNDLKELIPANRQKWRQACVDLVLGWFSALCRKGEYFILSAVGQDQFIPLHIPRKFAPNEDKAKFPTDNSVSPSLLLRSRESAFSVVNSAPYDETSDNQNMNVATNGQRIAQLQGSQPFSCISSTPVDKASSFSDVDGTNLIRESKTTEIDSFNTENSTSGNSNTVYTTIETTVSSSVEKQNGCTHTLNADDTLHGHSGSVEDKSAFSVAASDRPMCVKGDDATEVLITDCESQDVVVSDDASSAAVISLPASSKADELSVDSEVPFTISVLSSSVEILPTSDDTIDVISDSNPVATSSTDVHSLHRVQDATAVESLSLREGDCHVRPTSEPAVVTPEASVVSVSADSHVKTESRSANEICADVHSAFTQSTEADSTSTNVTLTSNNACKQSNYAPKEANATSKASNGTKIAANELCLPDATKDASSSSGSTGSAKSDEDDNDEAGSSSCNSRSNRSDSLPRLKLVGHLTEGVSSDPVAPSDAIQMPIPRPAHLLKANASDLQNSALKQSCPVLCDEILEHRLLSDSPETRNHMDGKQSSDSARVYRRPDNVHKVMVMVTSSLVDVICLLQRLICVTETLGVALYLPALNSRGSFGDGAAESKMDELWINLKKHLEKVIQNLTILYAKNLLAMDLCAISQKTAAELTGNELVEELIRSRGSIWGCRHKASGSDCLRYVNRHEEFRDSRHEPLSKEMCFRINNLLQLRKMLPAFFQKSAFGNVGDTTSPLTVTEDFLNSTISGLINIFVYRMQLFVIDFLTQLISQLPSRADLETTLQPFKHFLSGHLTSMQQWLCSENYSALMDRLWLSLSGCFEKCAQDVIHNPSHLSLQRADCLLQTIVVVIRLIIKLNVTNPNYIKVKHLDAVLYWLQLYSEPTYRLISIYQLLCLKKNVWNLETPLPYGCDLKAFENMRYDLHSSRKCFQGQQLIDWISSHLHAFPTSTNQSRQSFDNIKSESDNNSPSGIRDTANHSPYDLAQAFIDTGAVQPLDFSSPQARYSTSSITSDPYPRLVFHGTVKPAHDSETLLLPDDLSKNVHSEAPENSWFSDDTQTLQTERRSSSGSGVDIESKLSNATASPSPQKSSFDADKTFHNGRTDVVYIDPVGPNYDVSPQPNDDVSPAEQLTQEGASSTTHGCSLNSSPANVVGSPLTFYIAGWYQIPSPSEAVTLIDPIKALSQGRLREVNQCLQFFIAKKVRKEMILSIVASRKKNDELAKQFIQSLPRDVISKYPWLYVKEQTVLACLGLLT